MSYREPEEIYLKDHDIFIALATKETVDELDRELRAIGLKTTAIQYYENEYCPERDRGCPCPHWFAVKIELLHSRIYEPNIWFWVCKRKRVYELRWGGSRDGKQDLFVGDDFWINNAERTQGKGHIHSYGLVQAASDIKVAHQAAEIHHYKKGNYDEHYAGIFKAKVKDNG